MLCSHITLYMCLCISFCRCLEWLLNNLMTHQNVDLMKELGWVCSAHSFLVFLLALILSLGIIVTFLIMKVSTQIFWLLINLITMCYLIKMFSKSFSAVTFLIRTMKCVVKLCFEPWCENIVFDHTHHLSLPCIHRADMMEQLIQSSDLFVMQVEMDVYTALKKVHEDV